MCFWLHGDWKQQAVITRSLHPSTKLILINMQSNLHPSQELQLPRGYHVRYKVMHPTTANYQFRSINAVAYRVITNYWRTLLSVVISAF